MASKKTLKSTQKTAKVGLTAKGRAMSSRHPRLYILGQWVLWTLTVISVVGLLLACFGGCIRPEEMRGVPIMILTLPVWLVLWFIIAAMDALWCRKALIICILAFIACANAIWNFCPLNLFGPSEKKYEGCPRFTLLTYNICSFMIQDKNYEGEVNPTVSFIIKTNADIVCLQETDVNLSGPFNRYKITSEQIDSINKMYPYRLVYGHFLTLLSKYPAEAIHTPPLDSNPKQRWRNYPIAIFRVNIEGTPITLFDVHMQSYELTNSDKAIYKNIADGKEIVDAVEGNSLRSQFSKIRHHILHKVQDAAVKRAEQADALARYVEKFGGPNVIIAGDFNDVPGCYTLNLLEDYDFHQVYPKVGFGPMITFNADMFYFRIDHVLYRGCLEPLRMVRGSTKSSDHYPVLVTFAINENN